MIRARPCIVCETPCTSEGQLCRDCVAKGHRVENDRVIVNIEIRVPEVWRP
jgi:hypothetical protein